MSIDELIELEQDITKAKVIADILFSETMENDEKTISNEEHEKLAHLSSILIDYLAAAKQEISRIEVILDGKN